MTKKLPDIFMEIYRYKHKSIREMSRKIKYSESNIYPVILKLLEIGLIKKEKLGRRIIIHYTEKGLILYNLLIKIKNI